MGFSRALLIDFLIDGALSLFYHVPYILPSFSLMFALVSSSYLSHRVRLQECA